MARLTFADDLDTLTALSKSVAAAFVRISGRADLRDDAVNDALVALLSIDYDATNAGARSYLKKRALGALIRDYQRKTGRRLKNAPKFIEYTDAATVAPPSFDDDDNGVDHTGDDDKTAVEIALQCFSGRELEIIKEWLSGKKQIKIASDRNLTRGRISQIIAQFKHKARFIRQYGRRAVVVNPKLEPTTAKERAAMPLFFV